MNYIDHYREAQEKDEQIARLQRDLLLAHETLLTISNNYTESALRERSLKDEVAELRNRLRLSVGDMFDKTDEDKADAGKDLIDWAKMWGGFPTPSEPEKPVDPRSEVLRRAIASDKPWTP